MAKTPQQTHISVMSKRGMVEMTIRYGTDESVLLLSIENAGMLARSLEDAVNDNVFEMHMKLPYKVLDSKVSRY